MFMFFNGNGILFTFILLLLLLFEFKILFESSILLLFNRFEFLSNKFNIFSLLLFKVFFIFFA